jgi:hypothetical protein
MQILESWGDVKPWGTDIKVITSCPLCGTKSGHSSGVLKSKVCIVDCVCPSGGCMHAEAVRVDVGQAIARGLEREPQKQVIEGG